MQLGDGMSVVVSEYAIEVDYFHEVPPDDNSKCIRKFAFLFHAVNKVSKLTMELGTSKKEFTLRETFRDSIFQRIPDDRNAREANVAVVFREFHDEMWLINSSLLLKALMDCEDEVRLGKVRESLEEASKTRDENNEKEEYLVTEDSMWEKRMETSSQETSQPTDLVTEDSLFEKRYYE